jgi:hypothetical protein
MLQVSATDFSVAGVASPSGTVCCGYGNPSLNPSYWWGFIGDTTTFTPGVINACTQKSLLGLADSWWTDDPLIASVTQMGVVKGLSNGFTNTNAEVQTRLTGVGFCAEIFLEPVSAGTEIAPVADFTVSGPQTITDGEQGTFQITVTGGTPTSYQWSFTSPNGWERSEGKLQC